MHAWHEDLLTAMESPLLSEGEIFARLEAAAADLGFEYCAYGLRVPIPLTRPQTVFINNYPVKWQQRYSEANYIAIDPTVLHGRRSAAPLVWSDSVFESAPELWSEARDFGLQVGWAQSSLDGHGIGGMITLARSGDSLIEAELHAKEARMRWLVNVAHVTLARRLAPRVAGPRSELTPREVEVLQWTADGKTAPEIAEILNLSAHTIVFHVNRAMRKLDASNKTAAAIKAAMLGLLN